MMASLHYLVETAGTTQANANCTTFKTGLQRYGEFAIPRHVTHHRGERAVQRQ